MFAVLKQTEKAFQVKYTDDKGSITEWVSKSLVTQGEDGTCTLNEKGESIFKTKADMYQAIVKEGFKA